MSRKKSIQAIVDSLQMMKKLALSPKLESKIDFFFSFSRQFLIRKKRKNSELLLSRLFQRFRDLARATYERVGPFSPYFSKMTQIITHTSLRSCAHICKLVLELFSSLQCELCAMPFFYFNFFIFVNRLTTTTIANNNCRVCALNHNFKIGIQWQMINIFIFVLLSFFCTQFSRVYFLPLFHCCRDTKSNEFRK